MESCASSVERCRPPPLTLCPFSGCPACWSGPRLFCHNHSLIDSRVLVTRTTCTPHISSLSGFLQLALSQWSRLITSTNHHWLRKIGFMLLFVYHAFSMALSL